MLKWIRTYLGFTASHFISSSKAGSQGNKILLKFSILKSTKGLLSVIYICITWLHISYDWLLSKPYSAAYHILTVWNPSQALKTSSAGPFFSLHLFMIISLSQPGFIKAIGSFMFFIYIKSYFPSFDYILRSDKPYFVSTQTLLLKWLQLSPCPQDFFPNGSIHFLSCIDQFHDRKVLCQGSKPLWRYIQKYPSCKSIAGPHQKPKGSSPVLLSGSILKWRHVSSTFIFPAPFIWF